MDDDNEEDVAAFTDKFMKPRKSVKFASGTKPAAPASKTAVKSIALAAVDFNALNDRFFSLAKFHRISEELESSMTPGGGAGGNKKQKLGSKSCKSSNAEDDEEDDEGEYDVDLDLEDEEAADDAASTMTCIVA